ncbi:Putative flippase GtrA (transmembrane translocase of bactoprenol-linked glucose) [Amycolatopsis arida]|uniref:Putative flippase GtrA (Transmembrane translocase of bactoprenol-linked glucose) n=1 Tax=Amycolatopsis arida TaxID=587909 RepID=A0A1I5YJ88_9PSEU|nr:GtrA family protein [Amycolatopsis arida]TDX90557.1 putative flippase GtrA [Amycolatopsis arida]SFQ44283.1 Putative flippase GtrA (transmembrane translocase of bactoprenol-linked glucose) [Amycolatopsis arida]
MVTTDPQAGPAAARPGSPGLLGQLVRFGLIGGFCALLDFGSYSALLALGMSGVPWVDVARAISFVIGTTTAFFLNRRFTFAAGQRGGAGQVGGFALLYTVTFFVAVGVNRAMLALLSAASSSGWETTIAWAVSQATATTINFVMLKWVVFREPRP